MKLKVISGGQTGADRTGLEVAKELGFETGGHAPKGYLTEDGPDPSLAQFGVLEHPSEKYPPRTHANAKLADLTVWFGKTGSPGFQCTKKGVERAHRPFAVNPSSAFLVDQIRGFNVTVLNVAGNRKSRNPDVVAQVRDVLGTALREIKANGQI